MTFRVAAGCVFRKRLAVRASLSCRGSPPRRGPRRGVRQWPECNWGWRGSAAAFSRFCREGASSGWERAGATVVGTNRLSIGGIMYQRPVTVLMFAAGLLGLLEFVSAIVIWKENYPDSEPLFAVAFGVLFLG